MQADTPSGARLPSSRALLRGGVASVALRVIKTVLGIGLSVTIARVLSPDGYGIYASALAVVTILGLPAQFGLQALVVRETAGQLSNRNWSELRGVLRFGFRFVSATSFGLGVGGVLIVWSVSPPGEGRSATLVALAMLPLLALGSIRGAALRGLGRVIQGQLPEFVLAPGVALTLIAVALVRGASLTPSGVMGLRVLGAAAAFAIGTWMLLRALPPAVRRAVPSGDQRTWLRSTVPLALITGLQLLQAQLGTVIVKVASGSTEAGLFAVAVQGSLLVTFVFGSTGMILGPAVARVRDGHDTQELQATITRISRWNGALALPVALLMTFAGREILGIVFGPEFMPGYAALAVLSLGQFLHAVSGPSALTLTMLGYEHQVARITVATTCVNLLATIALTVLLGATGAALGVATALSFHKAALHFATGRLTGLNTMALIRLHGRSDP